MLHVHFRYWLIVYSYLICLASLQIGALLWRKSILYIIWFLASKSALLLIYDSYLEIPCVMFMNYINSFNLLSKLVYFVLDIIYIYTKLQDN